MVKGVSKQVIVVQSPDPKLFEQAIFILKEDVRGITDEELLKEAKLAARGHKKEDKKRKLYLYGPVWACGGAVLTGLAWLLSVIL